MSNYKQALEAAVEFRKKLGSNAANAAACAMMDDIIKKIEESAVEKSSTSSTRSELERMRLESVSMNCKVLGKTELKLEAQAREHACNIEQKEAFFPHEVEERKRRILDTMAARGLKLQQTRTEKEKERLTRLRADLLQMELDGRKASAVHVELESKREELAQLESKIPKAQSALKFLEDKINAKSKELHTKPLKGKKEEPLTATIGEQVAAAQQKSE